ncbi:hypothetical protein I4U23_015790 [Adineta vaga]|nr:hypothetical protein I4U23_015790 [Adineta vaga]
MHTDFAINDELLNDEYGSNDESPFPSECKDEIYGIELFYKCFISRYYACPTFFYGSLYEACQAAFASANIKERCPLLVYIHNGRSTFSNTFCETTFCSEVLIDYLLENYIVWPWDITLKSNEERLLIIWQKTFFLPLRIDYFVDKYPMLIGIRCSSSGLIKSFEFTSLLRGDRLTRTQVKATLDTLLSELIAFKEEPDLFQHDLNVKSRENVLQQIDDNQLNTTGTVYQCSRRRFENSSIASNSSLHSTTRDTEHHPDLLHFHNDQIKLNNTIIMLIQETSIDLNPSTQTNQAVRVYVRLVFLRIGEIDTLNEKYQAHASIESRWSVSFNEFLSTLSIENQNLLSNGKTIILEKYTESYWHPQLYIENSLGDLKEQIKYTAKINKYDNLIYICEHRIIKGLFWEKLELHHFPSDVQDLSISVTSMFFHEKVLLCPDPYQLSGINREAFIDQQEWSLYEHVDSEQRFIKDFLFSTDDNDEHEMKHRNNKEEPKRSVLTVTCHAARQSAYFFWNGYFLILLITSVSFCTFGMPMQVAINRLQVSCTLLLTSVTFRWTVNRSLPTVSYLTSLDKYGLLCMTNLVIHSFWHSVISVITWTRTTDYRATSDSWITSLDHGAFYVTLGIFVAFHIVVIIWFFSVPFHHRKQMEKKDKHYRTLVLEMVKTRDHQILKQHNNGYTHTETERI